MKKCAIFVVDGCSPAYLTANTVPGLFQLARRQGFAKVMQGAVPTVTNVNHACILSGEFPEITQVVGNYFYNPATKEEGFVEERGFMQAPTVLQAYQRQGQRTALLTVKGKILGVYGQGADLGLSAQNPDEGLLGRLDLENPPPVGTLESTWWIYRAAVACVERESPDLLYCTTNDYAFHHYGPGTPQALEQVRWLDEAIGTIHALEPDRQIYVTADHGMNQKHHLVNFQRMCDNRTLAVHCLAPLKDRYVENHPYQEGGVLYLFLEREADREPLIALAKSLPQVEKILTSEEASAQYHLPVDRIGDYVLFAAPDCAFGETEGETLETDQVRTHGSLYEREVPLVAIHPQGRAEDYAYSKDIVHRLLHE